MDVSAARWIVVFRDLPAPPPEGESRPRRWLRRVLEAALRPGFRHVTLIHFSGFPHYRWSLIDPHLDGCVVRPLIQDKPKQPAFLPPMPALHDALAAWDAKMMVWRGPAPEWVVVPRYVTCVGAVRRLLWVRGGLLVPCLTPWQLFRLLGKLNPERKPCPERKPRKEP